MASNNFFLNLAGGGLGGFVFSPSHVFADNAARDAYFDSPDPHLDELVNANNLQTLILSGNEFQRWDGANQPATYTNTDWTAFQESGLAMALTGIPDGNIPQKTGGANGVLSTSTLNETTNQLVSNKEIVTTPTSLIWGENGAELASAGQEMVFTGTNNDEYFVITNKFDPMTGSYILTRSRLIPRDDYTIQPGKTVTSAQNPTFSYTISAIGNPTEDVRHTDQITIEAANSGTITAVFRENDQNGKLLRRQSVAVTADTEEPINLNKPICLEVGTVVHVTITGDIQLKGETISSQFAPFLKVRSYLGYTDQIATADTMDDLAATIRDSLQSLTGNARLVRSAVYQEIVNIDNSAVTGDDYEISASDNGKLLMCTRGIGTSTTITIPAGIEGNVSFFDIFIEGLGSCTVRGKTGENVRINDESDIQFSQHEGGRITKTTTANRWGVLFDERDTATTEDNYVDSMSFNTGSRLLTLGRTGTLPDLTETIPAGSSGATFESILNLSTQTGAHQFTNVNNFYAYQGVNITSYEITDTSITDFTTFAIKNDAATDLILTLSAGTGLTFEADTTTTTFTLKAGVVNLFLKAFGGVYFVADFGDTSSASGDHPLIVQRDTPTLTELAAIAAASIGGDTGLWLVANDQVQATEDLVDTSIMIRALKEGLPDANGDAISTISRQKRGLVLLAGTKIRVFSNIDLRVVSVPGQTPMRENFPDIPFTGAIRLEESDQGLYNSYLRRTATNSGGSNQYIAMPNLQLGGSTGRPSWVRPGDVFAMRHTGTTTGSQRPHFRPDNTGDNIASHGTQYFASPGQTIAIQAPALGIRTWQLYPISQNSDGTTTFDPTMSDDSMFYVDDAGAVATNNSLRLHHNQELVEGNVRDHVLSSTSSNNPVTVRWQHRNIQDDIAWIQWHSVHNSGVPPIGVVAELIPDEVETALTWIENNIGDNYQFELLDPTVTISIDYVTFQSGQTVKIGLVSALPAHMVTLDVITINNNSFAANNGDWAITQIYGDRLAIDITIPGSSAANDTATSGFIDRTLYCTSALVSDDFRQHNFNMYRNAARNNPVTVFLSEWFDFTTDPAPAGNILNIGYNNDLQTTGSILAVQDDAGDFFQVKGGPRQDINYVDNITTPVTTGTALPINFRNIEIGTSSANIFYIPEFPDQLDIGESRIYRITSLASNTLGNCKLAVGAASGSNMLTFDEGIKEWTVIPGDPMEVELYNNGNNNGARLHKHIHRQIKSNLIYPTLTALPSVSFLLPFTSANLDPGQNQDPNENIFDFSTDNRVTVLVKGRYTFRTSMRVWFVGTEPANLRYASPILTPYTTGDNALYEYAFSNPLILSNNGVGGNGAYITLLANFEFEADIDDWFEFEIQTSIPTGFTVTDFRMQNFNFSITADIGG